MAMINVKLDDVLRRRFKMLCAEKDVTMRDEIVWLITRDIEHQTKAKQKK
jgi:hypothetical protein